MNQDYLVEKTIGFDQIEAKYGISRRRIRRMMNSGPIFPSVAYHPLGGKTHGGKYLRHLFSKSDVLEIVIVSELLSQGFQLKKVRGVLEFIRRNLHQLSGDVYQTDGRTIWQRDLVGLENDYLINPESPQQTIFLKWKQIQEGIRRAAHASG